MQDVESGESWGKKLETRGGNGGRKFLTKDSFFCRVVFMGTVNPRLLTNRRNVKDPLFYVLRVAAHNLCT